MAGALLSKRLVLALEGRVDNGQAARRQKSFATVEGG